LFVFKKRKKKEKKRKEELVIKLISNKQMGIHAYIRVRRIGYKHTRAKSLFRDRNISCFFRLQSSTISRGSRSACSTKLAT